MTVTSRWLVAWLGAAAIGVSNGVLREATYGRWLSERAAHQVSTLTALGGFTAYFGALQRRWPTGSREQAVRIGALWLALTVAFEFGFGRVVARQSWDDLLRDYNIASGRTWPLVLAWIAAGPAVVRELQAWSLRRRGPAAGRHFHPANSISPGSPVGA